MKMKTYIFLALAQTMGGVNIVSAKYLLPTIPIFLLLAVRFLFAAIILFCLHYTLGAGGFKKHLLSLKKQDWFFIVLAAISAGAAFNLLMLWGLDYTDANIAGIITSALPAMVALLSWLILRETLDSKKACCIALATLGLIIISTQKLTGNSAHYSLKGDLIILLSLVPEAGYYIFSKIHPNHLPVFLVAGLINAINAILLFPAMFFYHFQWEGLLFYQTLALIALIVSSALFYVFWYMGSKGIDTALASLSTAFMPIATLIIAWICLKETILPVQLLGMFCVIFSVFFYASPRRYKKRVI